MGRPKQFLGLLGCPALSYTLRAFEEASEVARIYVVGDRGRVEGLVSKNGLPGPVRTSMEEAGLLPAGTDHWLIEAGKDPARTKSIGQTMGLAGAGMLAVGLLLNVNRFRRR